MYYTKRLLKVNRMHFGHRENWNYNYLEQQGEMHTEFSRGASTLIPRVGYISCSLPIRMWRNVYTANYRIGLTRPNKETLA